MHCRCGLVEQLKEASTRYLDGELTGDDYLHRCVMALAYMPESGCDLHALAEIFVDAQRPELPQRVLS